MTNSIDIVSCRLVKDKKLSSDIAIKSPITAIKLIVENFYDLEKEYLFVLNCDSKLHPNNISIVSIGNEKETSATATNFFRTTIMSDSSNVIMLHNHPSGDITPSNIDEKAFKKIKDAGKLLDINVMDSIIFNYDRDYYSMEFKKKNQLSYDELQERIGLNLKTSYVRDVGFVRDEAFQKVVNEYLKTTSSEVIITDKDRIIKINTEGDLKFKEAVEEGKVNIYNIRDYTKDEIFFYEYSSYKEVFEASIKESIISDMDSLGIVDEEGKWNFYISPEDIKNVGLSEVAKEQLQEMIDEGEQLKIENIFENEE